MIQIRHGLSTFLSADEDKKR